MKEKSEVGFEIIQGFEMKEGVRDYGRGKVRYWRPVFFFLFNNCFRTGSNRCEKFL